MIQTFRLWAHGEEPFPSVGEVLGGDIECQPHEVHAHMVAFAEELVRKYGIENIEGRNVSAYSLDEYGDDSEKVAEISIEEAVQEIRLEYTACLGSAESAKVGRILNNHIEAEKEVRRLERQAASNNSTPASPFSSQVPNLRYQVVCRVKGDKSWHLAQWDAIVHHYSTRN